MSIDEQPFRRHGIAGAFAYGLMQRWEAANRHMGDDGVRAVCAPIGVECRPALPPSKRPPYEPPPRVDPYPIVSEAVRSFERTLSGRDARTWRREVDVVKASIIAPRTIAEIAERAYYGFGDMNHGVQTILTDVSPSTQSEFGFMLWNFSPFRDPVGWYEAVHAGVFAATLPEAMGERGWAEIERLAACSRA